MLASNLTSSSCLKLLSAGRTHLRWTPDSSLDSDLTEGCAPPADGFMESIGTSGHEFFFPFKRDTRKKPPLCFLITIGFLFNICCSSSHSVTSGLLVPHRQLWLSAASLVADSRILTAQGPMTHAESAPSYRRSTFQIHHLASQVRVWLWQRTLPISIWARGELRAQRSTAPIPQLERLHLHSHCFYKGRIEMRSRRHWEGAEPQRPGS